MKHYPVAVNISLMGTRSIAFTPDTQEERAKAITMMFNEDQAADLISGDGIDVTERIAKSSMLPNEAYCMN